MKFILKCFTGKLSFQIGLSVVVFITLIEVVIFQVTLEKREKDFYKLANKVNGIAKEHGIPNILGKQYIKSHVDEFTRNVIIAVLVIIAVVTIGVLAILYFIVTRHIYRLDRINQETDLVQIILYPEDCIPHNELGDSIKQRNKMVRKLQNMHQELIAGKAASEVYRVTNKVSHEVLNPLSIVSGSSELIRELVDDATVQHHVTNIDSSVDRIARLVSLLNKYGELLSKGDSSPFCLKGAVEHVLEDSSYDKFRVTIGSKCKEDSCIYDSLDRVHFVLDTIFKVCKRELERINVEQIHVDIDQDENSIIATFRMSSDIDTKEIYEQFKTDSLSVVDVGFGEGADLHLSKTLIELGQGSVEGFDDGISAGIKVKFPRYEEGKKVS